MIDRNEGSEPAATLECFKGKTDRYAINPKILDSAPKGLRTALCFFSDEAFRFYIPAYMVADLRGELAEVDVVYFLTHGLDDKTRGKLVNPQRYGRRTWFDASTHRLSVFSSGEATAIISYLKFKIKEDDMVDASCVEQAVANYWEARIV